MSEPDFRQMGDPVNDRLPTPQQWLQSGAPNYPLARDDYHPNEWDKGQMIEAMWTEIDTLRSALRYLNEADELRRRDKQWAADVVWRADWMTRAINLLGEIREDLEHELTEAGHLAALEDLLHEEFDDGEGELALARSNGLNAYLFELRRATPPTDQTGDE